MSGEIHVDRMGCYHPRPLTGPTRHAAQCSVCGFKAESLTRSLAEEQARRHGLSCQGPLGPDCLALTWQEPGPDDGPSWTINDTRGYTDGGPHCDKCEACDCGPDDHDHDICIGLSFAFICLDGGESLCEDCAEKEGITIVPCDC